MGLRKKEDFACLSSLKCAAVNINGQLSSVGKKNGFGIINPAVESRSPVYTESDPTASFQVGNFRKPPAR